MSIELKSKAEIEIMRRANLVVYDVLQELAESVEPGVTTRYLDEKAREITANRQAEPAFLNYPSVSKDVLPFPGVICASVNEVIVHGIPDNVPLKDGDIISIDYGCSVDGFFGDSAITVPVGKISREVERLLQVTAASLEDAIEQCISGKRIGDISAAVQKRVEKNGFNVVREFVGHGIGRAMHEPPHVPNFGREGLGRVLKPGMCVAIEPMVTAGSSVVEVLENGWNAVTKDRSLAAHFEHSVAITTNGPLVLSRP